MAGPSCMALFTENVCGFLQGFTALMLACITCKEDQLDVEIEHGGYRDQTHIVKILLAAGADMSAVNESVSLLW